jgi:hypothetical protein
MATTKRLLPVGIQDFSDIRTRGFVYVDKTARAYDLITGSGKAFFLSRPRRFGKSLLCSTLGAIFEGRRELFGEIAGRPALAMDGLDWEWRKHPVIYLDLSAENYIDGGKPVLNALLQNELDNAARRYGVVLRGQTVPLQFRNLIVDLHEGLNEMVVVIIDEYDSPLTGTLTKRDVHIELRDELRAFYSVLKSCDAHLRFVFLTGVVKFSHMGIFSALNNVSDISLDSRYADICGLTQEELEANFEPEIACLLDNIPGREEYLGKLRQFYNGYRFSSAPITVYNPSDLFTHFNDDGDFPIYWPNDISTIIADLLCEQKLDTLNISDMQIWYDNFEMFCIEEMEPEPLLYQTGYLTITDYDETYMCFKLDYPNIKARTSLADTLVK